jgi:hypothetical protein
MSISPSCSPHELRKLNHVRIFRSHLSQRRRQSNHIIIIGPARPMSQSNLGCDRFERRFSKPIRIGWRCDIHERLVGETRSVGTIDRQEQAVITTSLAHIERREHILSLRIVDLVCASPTSRACFCNERHYATRCADNAAVIRRALPETARITTNQRGLGPDEWERGTKNERAVTEDPKHAREITARPRRLQPRSSVALMITAHDDVDLLRQ